MARLFEVPALTWCLAASSGLCNLGASWGKAEPVAMFIMCFVFLLRGRLYGLALVEQGCKQEMYRKLSSESKRLCQALAQALNKTLEVVFKEILLFLEVSLIKII